MLVNISLGENCIIDALLKRYNIKRESFIFGSVRTNIEYNFEIIKNEMKYLIDKKYLKKTIVNNITPVIKNTKYTNISKKIYDGSVSSGFEFTHHNVLENVNAYNSYCRKISRMKHSLQNDSIIFWYHYRYSKLNNIDELLIIFRDFIKYLKAKYNQKIKICIFTQILDKNTRFHHEKYDEDIHIIKCYDENKWGGNNVGGNINTLKRHSFIKMFDVIFKEYNIYKKILTDLLF